METTLPTNIARNMMLARLGDSAAITLIHAGDKELNRLHAEISFHPSTREEYSTLIGAIRKVYKEFAKPLYECAEYHSDGLVYGSTDFYTCAEHAADSFGNPRIIVFWPSTR